MLNFFIDTEGVLHKSDGTKTRATAEELQLWEALTWWNQELTWRARDQRPDDLPRLSEGTIYFGRLVEIPIPQKEDLPMMNAIPRNEAHRRLNPLHVKISACWVVHQEEEGDYHLHNMIADEDGRNLNLLCHIYRESGNTLTPALWQGIVSAGHVHLTCSVCKSLKTEAQLRDSSADRVPRMEVRRSYSDPIVRREPPINFEYWWRISAPGEAVTIPFEKEDLT